MPDIEIIVEASLGDSLAKLGLAKTAVDELGTSGDETGQKLHDFNTAMDDSTIASSRAGEQILKTDQLIRDAGSAIDDTADAIDGGNRGRGGFGGGITSALTAMGDAADADIPLLLGFSTTLAQLPVLATAAIVGIIALADVFGTLLAVVGDLVAPVTLVTGLLGGLGAAFIVGATKASEGKGPFKDFGDTLSHLKDMFGETATLLGEDFLPQLNQLAHGAEEALRFVDKLAHEPLDKAMHDMATQGVQMLNRFVEQVSHVVAKPIRLAFQIAFGAGPGGNEFASAVAGWWKQFNDFLFGYTVRHPIELRPGVFKMEASTVNGILQPLVDWFDRHHFTRQGEQIGHDILDGMMSSGAAQRMGQFLIQTLEDASKTAAVGIWDALEAKTAAIQAVFDGWGKAMISAEEAAAEKAWHAIEGVFSNPISLVVDLIPHIAGGGSGLSGLLSRAGGLAQTIETGGLNQVIGHTTLNAHYHYHAAAAMSPAAERAAFDRFASRVGTSIARQQGLLAGGI
jgi:hypothetical protein